MPFRLNPLPAALGLRPAFWLAFTFMCKWVYLEDQRSHKAYCHE